MEVGVQRLVPAGLTSTKIWYPLYRRLGGPEVRSGRLRNFPPATGIRSPDRPARSQSLWHWSIIIKLGYYKSVPWCFLPVWLYRVADKSLARPGRKQDNVSVRMAWISFGALPCRKKNLMTARVSMFLKSRASLTCFRACYVPGRAKDLSAPRYIITYWVTAWRWLDKKIRNMSLFWFFIIS